MKYHRTSAIITSVVGVLVAVALAITLWPTPQGVAQEQQPILEYPDFPPTPTIGPNPTAAPALASGPALASSGFDDPAALAAWQLVDLQFTLPDTRSVWTVSDGRLEQDATAAAGNPSIQETAALTGDPAWSDYTVRVSFYDQYNGTAGLIARYRGSDPTTASYYRYRILKDSFEATPKQVLERVVGGVATPLVELKSPGFSEQQWHTLSLTVVGGQLTVTLDGQVVVEAEDPTPLPGGQAGLYTRAVGGLLFDDFAVVAP